MIDKSIQAGLVLLFIFTPIALGSMPLWAFSLMEFGILSLLVLEAIRMLQKHPPSFWDRHAISPLKFDVPVILLFLFLLLVFFQWIPLPSGLVKVLSPKTYEYRLSFSLLDPQSSVSEYQVPLSFVPFATEIEFFKWFTLLGLFFFLRNRFSHHSHRRIELFIVVIFLVGVAESFYGMFEFFSGHHHILHLDASTLMSSVRGTFINHNYFAGYLLMAIPLSIGLFFSRLPIEQGSGWSWRRRLSSLDGKTVLIAYGVIVMIVGLLLSASRMGITSLLLSLSVLSFLFRNPGRERRFSKVSILILGLAVLWAAWIGLDAVISRFLSIEESFKLRWMTWVTTIQIAKDFLLLGSGLGTFPWIFRVYQPSAVDGLVTHAENDFLQLASEVGLVGIGLLLVSFGFLFFKSISVLRSPSLHGRPERYVGIGAMVGILALMFHSTVERNLQIPANAFLFTFLWALTLRFHKKNGRSVGRATPSAAEMKIVPEGKI